MSDGSSGRKSHLNAVGLTGKGVLLYLSSLDPDPEEPIADQERAVVPVNEIPIEQALHRPLRIRRGSQPVPPDKSTRKRFDSSRFGCEPS